MAERSYEDSCALARALDVIGDRWAMLIVRELLLGPKRFVDLRRGLSGISQNVLSQRLRDLERVDVLERIVLDPPANSPAYRLTARGLELRPALIELARWGAGAPTPEGADQGPAAFMLTLEAVFDPLRAEPVTGSLAIGRERFTITTGSDGLIMRRGDDDAAAFLVTGSIPALRAAILAGVDKGRQTTGDELTIRGDRDAFDRFRQAFQIPSPVA